MDSTMSDFYLAHHDNPADEPERWVCHTCGLDYGTESGSRESDVCPRCQDRQWYCPVCDCESQWGAVCKCGKTKDIFEGHLKDKKLTAAEFAAVQNTSGQPAVKHEAQRQQTAEELVRFMNFFVATHNDIYARNKAFFEFQKRHYELFVEVQKLWPHMKLDDIPELVLYLCQRPVWFHSRFLRPFKFVFDRLFKLTTFDRSMSMEEFDRLPAKERLSRVEAAIKRHGKYLYVDGFPKMTIVELVREENSLKKILTPWKKMIRLWKRRLP